MGQRSLRKVIVKVCKEDEFMKNLPKDNEDLTS